MSKVFRIKAQRHRPRIEKTCLVQDQRSMFKVLEVCTYLTGHKSQSKDVKFILSLLEISHNNNCTLDNNCTVHLTGIIWSTIID